MLSGFLVIVAAMPAWLSNLMMVFFIGGHHGLNFQLSDNVICLDKYMGIKKPSQPLLTSFLPKSLLEVVPALRAGTRLARFFPAGLLKREGELNNKRFDCQFVFFAARSGRLSDFFLQLFVLRRGIPAIFPGSTHQR